MFIALKLVFFPFQTWQEIVARRRSVLFIILAHLLPLFFVALAAENLSLTQWGEPRAGLASWIKYSQEAIMRYSGAQAALFMASILFGALIMQWVAHGSQVQTGYTQCFTLMAYSFCPFLLVRFFDAIPGLNSWVCWGLGALGALAVLYHGVGLALKPDQTKGFGLYLVSIIIVLFSGFFSHFMAQFILRGKVTI